MAGFSAYDRNNMLSTLRQQSNEQSNFMSRNDGYGQTLVLYRSKVFITLDGNTITDDSFNNKGNGYQDFSSADINSIVSAIRNKSSSPPSPSPSPAINTVSTHPNQHYASSNAGMQETLKCAICKRKYPCPPGKSSVHCLPCNPTSYRY